MNKNNVGSSRKSEGMKILKDFLWWLVYRRLRYGRVGWRSSCCFSWQHESPVDVEHVAARKNPFCDGVFRCVRSTSVFVVIIAHKCVTALEWKLLLMGRWDAMLVRHILATCNASNTRTVLYHFATKGHSSSFVHSQNTVALNWQKKMEQLGWKHKFQIIVLLYRILDKKDGPTIDCTGWWLLTQPSRLVHVTCRIPQHLLLKSFFLTRDKRFWLTAARALGRTRLARSDMGKNVVPKGNRAAAQLLRRKNCLFPRLGRKSAVFFFLFSILHFFMIISFLLNEPIFTSL